MGGDGADGRTTCGDERHETGRRLYPEFDLGTTPEHDDLRLLRERGRSSQEKLGAGRFPGVSTTALEDEEVLDTVTWTMTVGAQGACQLSFWGVLLYLRCATPLFESLTLVEYKIPSSSNKTAGFRYRYTKQIEGG